MSFEYFIARRIYTQEDGEKKISSPAIRVAFFSIVLGLTIMILAVSISVGFKTEIREKVSGFGSHIQITNFDNNTSYETIPIVVNDSLMNVIRETPNVYHTDCFATKLGMIKTDEDYMGIVLKGIDKNFNWKFFKQNLVKGELPVFEPDKKSMDVLISQPIAKRFRLNPGDNFLVYFILNDENVRARRLHVTGIFETNFSDFDKQFIISDINLIRDLNEWEEDQCSGIEILVNDFNRVDQTAEDLYYRMQSTADRFGNSLYAQSIKQLNPGIFAWLDVLDMNIIIPLILIILVSSFSMITGLLIIILEKNQLIGILKTLGENNTSLRKVFLYIAAFLIGKGLLWGNIVALTICFIQKQFGIFKLNPETYYISEVPIELNFWYILLLNLGTLAIILFILIVPTYLIAKISPVKVMKFE